ncbi:hypothetical protein DJ75_08460 [Halorubrum sp. Eb13]|nr:hypothetical protein DJ75_08460 [Halorubrum sp. Eb13]
MNNGFSAAKTAENGGFSDLARNRAAERVAAGAGETASGSRVRPSERPESGGAGIAGPAERGSRARRSGNRGSDGVGGGDAVPGAAKATPRRKD